MRRAVALVLTCGLLGLGLHTLAAAETAEQAEAKEALQELNEFIGQWNASGGPVRGSRGVWAEKIGWGWRFKGDDTWLSVEFKDGKLFKKGDLRYLPDKEAYELTLVDAEGKTRVFVGKLQGSYLTMESVDPETRETTQLKMNTAAEGVRFIYQVSRKRARSTLWIKDYLVQGTREGQSLGAREKKIECVVSGGLGTMPISYKGATYYVCCSGCRDAFNENPEKYIKEFEAKKKKR